MLECVNASSIRNICDFSTIFMFETFIRLIQKFIFIYKKFSLTSLIANAKLRALFGFFDSRDIVRYDIVSWCLRSRSADPATPTGPPGVPVNFGSLSPKSRQRSIPRTSCFPNTLPSPTLLQISSASGLSRATPEFWLISRRLMVALTLWLF